MEETIGTRLKNYRRSKRLTQNGLSNLSGVSNSYISQIENNIYTNISLYFVCDLCKALEVTPNDLIPEHYYR